MTEDNLVASIESQEEKDVIQECSIYVPVNIHVCSEQDDIPGYAKETKYIICSPSLKNFFKTHLQTE